MSLISSSIVQVLKFALMGDAPTHRCNASGILEMDAIKIDRVVSTFKDQLRNELCLT